MRTRSLLILVILAVVILAAGCCSSTSDSAASAAGTQAPAANPAKDTVAAEKTTAAPKTTAPPKLGIQVNSIKTWTSDFWTPDPGNEYILVDFSLTNNGYPNGFSFNPLFEAEVKDPDGYKYSADLAGSSVPGNWGVTDIALGETARGTLVFEVKKSPDGTKYTLLIDQ